jgi:hypothetical protein
MIMQSKIEPEEPKESEKKKPPCPGTLEWQEEHHGKSK